MRERTQSFAFLPATSTIATAVLTVAWWLTMAGLTAPDLPHLGLAVTSAAVGAAIVAVAAEPRVRAALSHWVFRRITSARQVVPPGLMDRWDRVHRRVVGRRSSEVALVRPSLPRAPGQGFTTA